MTTVRTIDEMLSQQKQLTIACENATLLSKTDNEAFAQIRKNGIGASDSSVVVGINKWKTAELLINEKCTPYLTAEEAAVGMLENVRKGSDLEPIILRKFEEAFGMTLEKPEAQYRFTEHPWLTINFDGITQVGEHLIPVEAKYVSMYANKYWDRSKAVANPFAGEAKYFTGGSAQEHISGLADAYGIPDYYFTQVQQELMALDAEFGYLVALFDKGWEIKVYKIFKDEFTQQCIIRESKRVWDRIQLNKGIIN